MYILCTYYVHITYTYMNRGVQNIPKRRTCEALSSLRHLEKPQDQLDWIEKSQFVFV